MTVLSAYAVIALSFIGPHSDNVVGLLIQLVVAGLGIGLSFVPMTLAAAMGVPTHEAGLASGLLNTSRRLGPQPRLWTRSDDRRNRLGRRRDQRSVPRRQRAVAAR